jgi:hypothetical protein
MDEGADASLAKLRRICVSAVRRLDGSGAGVSLIAENGVQQAMCASDPVTERIEELQFVLGEGPCIDAFRHRRPVLVPDLGAVPATRWPAYTPAAFEAGARAVFAFPLQVGAARLGVLDVFRSRPGTLRREEVTGALTLADIAVMLLLDDQEHATGDGDGDGDGGPAGVVRRRAELFQAQGMVMIQLGVSLADALARIRAHAFRAERRLDDVAADIVARRLTLEDHVTPEDHLTREGPGGPDRPEGLDPRVGTGEE